MPSLPLISLAFFSHSSPYFFHSSPPEPFFKMSSCGFGKISSANSAGTNFLHFMYSYTCLMAFIPGDVTDCSGNCFSCCSLSSLLTILGLYCYCGLLSCFLCEHHCWLCRLYPKGMVPLYCSFLKGFIEVVEQLARI